MERFFATEAVRADLGLRSASSGIYAVAGRGAQILLRVGSVAVLARLLTPDDFGVRALVLPVTILLAGVVNVGLNVAAVQREDLDHERLSRLFWFSSKFNLGLVALFALLGLGLARLYGDPRVTGVAAVWAAAFYVLNAGAFHESLLKRQMRFRALVTIQTAAMAAGIGVALIAAALGAGYWALVYEIGAVSIARALGAWMACAWRPARPRRGGLRADPAAAEMLSYGKGIAGFRAVGWLGRQLDRVLVGLLAGAPVLGLYDSARRWAWTPYLELHAALSDVAVASFSRVQAEARAYRRLVTRALAPILALALPATALIFVEALAVVHILLGDQWLGAVPYVRLMAVAAFFGSADRLTQWIYYSLGETGRLFRWSVIHTAVMILGLLIGANWGAIGVAAGFTGAVVALAYPAVWFCLRTAPLDPADFFGAAARPAAASLLGGGAAYAAREMLAGGLPLVPGFLVAAGAFSVVYLLAWVGLPGGRGATREILGVLGELWERQSLAPGGDPEPAAWEA